MNIQIVGPPGVGKSKLGDFIRNTIFKLDKDASILTNDPDRDTKSFGEGKNIYNIGVQQVPEDSDYFRHDMDADVVIVLKGRTVSQWFTDVYES